MRMSEPKIDVYTNYPCFTPQQVFDEVKPDLIVVETANSDLVEVSTEIARHGIPMHMDKPLGTDQEGYRRMSAICEARGVPLQIGYMFRSNEAINKMVELALNESMGRKVTVTKSKNKEGGVLQIEFYSDEELTELSNLLHKEQNND